MQTAVIATSLLGGAAVLAWRMRESSRPDHGAQIVIPPLGMSTGFGMFAYAPARIPLPWALCAFAAGALVLSYPLVRSSELLREGDAILLKRSKAFLWILIGLIAVRFAARAYVEQYVSPLQTGSIFFVLAFGMIARWRVQMYLEYRQLVASSAVFIDCPCPCPCPCPTPAGEFIAEAAAPMPIDVMTHVAVVIDDAGDSMTLYVDGELAASTALTASLTEIDGHQQLDWPLTVGSQCRASRRAVHELRIYAAALTPAQLATSLAAGPDPTFLAPSSTVPRERSARTARRCACSQRAEKERRSGSGSNAQPAEAEVDYPRMREPKVARCATTGQGTRWRLEMAKVAFLPTAAIVVSLFACSAGDTL